MTAQQPRIGLILCECGNNITDTVDLDAVAAWANKIPNVRFVFKHSLLCSPEGKEFVAETLLRQRPEYLVIAACSPRAHDVTFKSIAAQSKTDPANVHMANIREQCAWVTPDKAAATEKAKALIFAALQRVVLHQPLEQRSIECRTDLVIIGGGIAGIEAALLAAQAGRKVTLIEKNISVGGRTILYDELAPHMECSPCMLAPRLEKLKDDPNIRVIANAEVTDVVGFTGNFTVKVHKRAYYVNDTCVGCEGCFEACPVSVKSDFHLGLGNRKAIYTLFPGSVPAIAAIDKKNCLHFKDGSCDACVPACPFGSIDFTQQDEDFEIPAGAVIVATGSAAFDPASLANLGYKTIENVYTLSEFERLACSNGPTQGNVMLRNGQKPGSIAVIHCAGSLTDKGLAYCSGICCMLSVKVGELARKKYPDIKITNIHNRLVLPTPEAEEFYCEQKHAGTRFVSTAQLDRVIVTQANGKIKITGSDFQDLEADMLVLATGETTTADTAPLAAMLNLDRTQEGFFKPDHYFLRSMGSTLDGIYIVGGCRGACLVPEAVAQAQAAAGDVLSRLVPGRKIELETQTAHIDAELCSGCKLCVSVCPYHAIHYLADKNICEINEAICRGCGTCVATCASSAAQAKHFLDNQILAELEGVLHV